jgi:aspartate carbamoyltransferase catalytic subunit
MSIFAQSLLNLSEISLYKIETLLTKDKLIKQNSTQSSAKKRFFFADNLTELSHKVAILVFFEPSTRTLLSFQMACQRLGLPFLVFPPTESTSLSKGETLTDTVMNLLAMQPDILIIRSHNDSELESYLKSSTVPVINAGSGVTGHPTQALLDIFTMQESFGTLSGRKVLFVGDVRHSRVAESNLQVLKRMGAQTAYSCPESMAPLSLEWGESKYFGNLLEGLRWADVCMGLRVQTERHTDTNFSIDEYSKQFCLNLTNLKQLKSEAIIMHPGPFIRDLDLSLEVLKDPRCKIQTQVNNGVFMRAAILHSVLIKESSI